MHLLNEGECVRGVGRGGRVEWLSYYFNLLSSEKHWVTPFFHRSQKPHKLHILFYVPGKSLSCADMLPPNKK